MKVNKNNLDYYIEVENINGDTYIITSLNQDNYYNNLSSLTIKFNVEKNLSNSGNKLKLEIYNLEETKRRLLRKSRLDTNVYRKIELSVGYNGLMQLIFKGNISTANSQRNNTNFITTIEGRDGQFAKINSETNTTLINVENPLIKIAKDFKMLQAGYLTNMSYPPSVRGQVFSGKTYELMSKPTNANFFINNEKYYLLGLNEVINNRQIVFDNNSGLLKAPIESNGLIEIEMLLEPYADIGELATLNSEISPEFNGDYKIVGITHNGEISHIGKNGQNTTKVSLQTDITNLKRILTE